MHSRSLVSRFLVFIVVVLLPLSALAGNEVGKLNGNGSGVEWALSISGHDSITLTVQGPDGTLYEKTFKGGQTPSFRSSDLKKSGNVDGVYTYELRVNPQINGAVKAALQAARAQGDDAKVAEIMKANGLNSQVVQSGAFGVANGSFLDPNATEPTAHDSAAGRGGVTSSAATTGRTPGTVTADDQVIPDDLIVQGSTCTGLDCVNNESFGFDTLRLKENNLRIHFDDTSVSAGFPANDWRITANDSASGGANYLSFDDATGSKTPFKVEAGTPTNSLYVDSTGNIGFGNSSPVLNLHITDTDTPAIRQEQTSGGGFTAQTWDIGANEANWFVRDVTGGSRLPLRIRPGAPTSSVDIAATGDVGIGTASPDTDLHVEKTQDAAYVEVEVENESATGFARMLLQAGNGTAGSDFVQMNWNSNKTGGRQWTAGMLGSTTWKLHDATSSTDRITVDTSGNVVVNGNFSVTGTKAFAMVDPADDKKAIYYVALEGPEAGTYFRGTAKTVNGEAVIELPGYFSRITEPEKMTVQLTAVGKFGQVYVASKSPSQLVIKVPEGNDDQEFDYLVQGIRKGYADFQVERENDLPKPAKFQK